MVILEHQKKWRTHPFNLIVLAILYTIAIVSADSYQDYVFVLIIAYINLTLLTKGIKYKALAIFTLSLIPILLATLLSSYLFANVTSLYRLNLALLLSLRYFCLAIIPFSFTIHTSYPDVLNYLMQKKLIPVKIAYPVLAAFNSFYFLLEEFKRIQIANKMRYGKNLTSPRILLTLMEAASRYAHNLSISMHSRNLNGDKTFVTPYPKLTNRDYLLWGINLFFIGGGIIML